MNYDLQDDLEIDAADLETFGHGHVATRIRLALDLLERTALERDDAVVELAERSREAAIKEEKRALYEENGFVGSSEAWRRADKADAERDFANAELAEVRDALDASEGEATAAAAHRRIESAGYNVMSMAKLVNDTKLELEEERTKHRWIPVTERMPETDDDVLVVANGEARWAFVSEGEFFSNQKPIVGVTHWRPIPEVPKAFQQAAAESTKPPDVTRTCYGCWHSYRVVDTGRLMCARYNREPEAELGCIHFARPPAIKIVPTKPDLLVPCEPRHYAARGADADALIDRADGTGALY